MIPLKADKIIEFERQKELMSSEEPVASGFLETSSIPRTVEP